MNQVEYTLLVQRIFMAATGLSFVALSSMLVFLDPYSNQLYIWGFLVLLLLLLTGVISLFVFWWIFSIKKEILAITQVNQIVYQSLITACVVVFILALNQTGQMNVLTMSLVGLVYIFYWIWSTLR